MKKAISLFLLVIVINTSFAQPWTPSGTNMLNPNSGNVGIGPSAFSFTERLTLDGNLHVGDFSHGIGNQGANAFIKMNERFTFQSTLNPYNDWTRGIIAQNLVWNNTTNQWDVPSSFSDFSAIKMESNGNIGFYANYNTTAPYSVTEAQLQQYLRMWITGDGRVSIGNINPGSFRLAVDGKIGAREIKVTLQNPWPDYVFGSAYQRMSLANLEAFIQKNNHLPNIPSAQEVKENGGIELGDMNAKLLEKVEELTLYVIELKKEIEQIKMIQNSAVKK